MASPAFCRLAALWEGLAHAAGNDLPGPLTAMFNALERITVRRWGMQR